MNRRTKYGPLFFMAPDAAEVAGGSSPAPAAPAAIPAEASPTGQPIPIAPRVETAKPAEIVKVEAPPVVKQRGVIDVKNLLGLKESPSKTNRKEAEAVGKRNQSATIIPVPRITAKAKPPAAAPAAEAAPVVPVETPAPAVAKVKIGDEELTPDEIKARFDELKKATPAAASQTPEQKAAADAEAAQAAARAAAPAATETPEQIEARATEAKRLDDEAVARIAGRFTTTEDELDMVLSGGQGAVEALANIRAKDHMEIRKWVQDTLNPIFGSLNEQISPILKMHAEVSAYQREEAFFTAAPDLKPHQKLVRDVSQALDRIYMADPSTMTPEQQVYAAKYRAMTQAERDAEVAASARKFVTDAGGKLEIPAAAPAAAPAATPPAAALPAAKPAAKPPASKPTPPVANLSQAATPAKAASEAGTIISRLIASGK